MQVRSRSSRLRAAAAIVVVVVAGALASCSRGEQNGVEQANAAGAKREAVLTVTAAELEPVELARTVTVNGSIFAWQDVIIASEVGGYRVAEVNVDVGDHVKRGQTLVELSTALLDADVATKRAILKQREAELVNAEASLERGKSLANMNVLSQADLDKLNSDALARRAAVESARADLDASSLRLKFTHVTAPDDGVITSRTVTVGQIAQAGGEMLRLLRNNRIEWRGEIPEVRITEVKPGQSATITTADGKAFKGTIRVVAPTITSTNRTGLVYVDLPSDEQLRPGMFARGEIELGRAPAFTVPLESVVS
ncbi:MAG TPA: efflux RND transporter periplasmic adaptor subunit, partial [Gammaproteobacteria bacterium]|nr:efflux RND transporter periplasmic adaptor subunit [Gammaproteobacteria bacterium]